MALPTDITLSNDSVYENLPQSTIVGYLSTTDADVGDTFTYSLVSGTGDADNASFYILGDELRTVDVFDYESATTKSIRIETEDSTLNTYAKAFTINILNYVTETPTIGSVSPIRGDSGDVGAEITGTNLNGANLQLLFDSEDVTKYITLRSNTKIRFQVPYILPSLYQITVVHAGGSSDAF